MSAPHFAIPPLVFAAPPRVRYPPACVDVYECAKANATPNNCHSPLSAVWVTLDRRALGGKERRGERVVAPTGDASPLCTGHTAMVPLSSQAEFPADLQCLTFTMQASCAQSHTIAPMAGWLQEFLC